jgi:hypothetical protein
MTNTMKEFHFRESNIINFFCVIGYDYAQREEVTNVWEEQSAPPPPPPPSPYVSRQVS